MPADQTYGPVAIGDVNAPANGQGVIALEYELSWSPGNVGAGSLLLHTTHFADGSWAPAGDVHGQIGNPGPVRSVAAVSAVSGEAQYMLTTQDGRLWHTTRYSNGSWAGLGDVFGQIGNPGSVHAVAATSAAAGQAQFLFCTDDGHLWHTTRFADGTWAPFGDVFGQIGDPGSVQAVAAACAVSGEAQFLFATEDGHLWHTVHRADGTWGGLGDVFGQIGDPGSPVRAVAATSATAGEAQFLFATEDGHLWHTVHRADGTWGGLGDVFGPIGDLGHVQAVTATSAASGEAQFLITGLP